MTEPRDYVEPQVSDARLERVWSSVSGRLEKRAGRSLRWALLGGALAATAAGGLWLAQAATGAPARAQLATGRLESQAAPLALSLKDGSSLQLAPRSALTVRGDQPASVSLSLALGRVSCDVPHREGRSFRVVAGDVEVRVVGTQFSVTATEGAAPRVEVSVLRGAVEVLSARRPGVVARVAAGQSWIQEAGAQAAPSPATPRPLPADPSSEPVAAPSTPQVESGTAPSNAGSVGPSARELFEKAGESRRSGDAAGAARAYEDLLKLHPSDARAGLSALELGRLRMDRLGDPAGAISALERAVASSLGPSFREDALARLVSVHAAQGNFAACGRARDRYLSSYPAGVHAAAVASRCGAR